MGERAVERRESGRLVAADRVAGRAVIDRRGVKIGTIEHVMIDKDSGRVACAVLSFGGFLGFGEKRFPLPWSLLDYDTEEGAFVVDIGEEALRQAPSYAAAEAPDWEDGTWARRLRDHYRVDVHGLEPARSGG